MHSEGRTWNSAVCFSIIASYLWVPYRWWSHAPTYRMCIVQWSVLVRRRPVIRMRQLFVLRYRWSHPAMCKHRWNAVTYRKYAAQAAGQQWLCNCKERNGLRCPTFRHSAHVVIGGIFLCMSRQAPAIWTAMRQIQWSTNYLRCANVVSFVLSCVMSWKATKITSIQKWAFCFVYWEIEALNKDLTLKCKLKERRKTNCSLFYHVLPKKRSKVEMNHSCLR